MHLLFSRLECCKLHYKCTLQPAGSINSYNINKVIEFTVA